MLPALCLLPASHTLLSGNGVTIKCHMPNRELRYESWVNALQFYLHQKPPFGAGEMFTGSICCSGLKTWVQSSSPGKSGHGGGTLQRCLPSTGVHTLHTLCQTEENRAKPTLLRVFLNMMDVPYKQCARIYTKLSFGQERT